LLERGKAIQRVWCVAVEPVEIAWNSTISCHSFGVTVWKQNNTIPYIFSKGITLQDFDKFLRDDLMHFTRGVKHIVPYAVFLPPIGCIFESEFRRIVQYRSKHTGDVVNYPSGPGMFIKEILREPLQVIVPENDLRV
jgi:hypothetical protein